MSKLAGILYKKFQTFNWFYEQFKAGWFLFTIREIFILGMTVVRMHCISASKNQSIIYLLNLRNLPIIFSRYFSRIFHFSLFHSLLFFNITSHLIFLLKPNRLEENLLGLFSFLTF